ANDADDPAAWQRERQSVDQHVVAVCLAQIGRDHHVVAETRRWRDLDLVLRDALELILARELLELLDTGFALCLPRARRHAHPLELVQQRALPSRLRL